MARIDVEFTPLSEESDGQFSIVLIFRNVTTLNTSISIFSSSFQEFSAVDGSDYQLGSGQFRSIQISQAVAGDFRYVVGPFTLYNDTAPEGLEFINLQLSSSGNTFANGQSFTTISIPLTDADPFPITSGDDVVTGTVRGDVINSLAGDDLIYGNRGDDRLNGGEGDDVIYGGFDAFSSFEDDGADVLFGDAGDDVLRGGASADSLFGGDGNDNLRGDGGNDTLNGGAGDDVVAYRFDDQFQPVTFDASSIGLAQTQQFADGRGGVDTLVSIEGAVLTGTSGGDRLTGSNGDDTLRGNGGADILLGGLGDDVIIQSLTGGATIDGGAGDDVIDLLSLGSGTVDGGTGTDRVIINAEYYSALTVSFDGANVTARSESMFSNSPARTFTGLNIEAVTANGDIFADTFTGGSGDDELRGMDGNDILSGGAGRDIISGGFGNDTLSGGTGGEGAPTAALAGGDVLDLSSAFSAATVDLAVVGRQNTGEGQDLISGFEDILGTRNDDVLRGDAAANRIDGNGGADRLAGLGGDDVLIAGDGGARDGAPDVVKSLFTNNGAIASAVSLDGAFDLLPNIEIDDAGTIPHATARGTASGASTLEYYAFTVSQPNQQITLDIDGAFKFDATLRLFDANGVLLAFNDDEVTANQFGGVTSEPLLRFTVATPGVYYAAVGALDGSLETGLEYRLHVSVPSATATPLFVPGSLLEGGDGADLLLGGVARDRLEGGLGNDSIRASSGDDVAGGQEGDDVILGENGDDALFGNAGRDTLSGGAGNDFATGQADNDILYGDAGDDLLFGNEGDDLLEGMDGRDRQYGGAGNDTIGGQAGDDDLYGEDGADTLYGNDGADFVQAGAGADVVYGGGGSDLIDANAGDDLIFGEAGDDFLFGDFGRDTIQGGAGADTIRGGADADILGGQAGADVIDGEGGDDFIWGNAGADRLFGGSGRDVFYFPNLSDSGSLGVDRIMDLSLADGDVVNLNQLRTQAQPFVFVSAFTNQAGQVTLTVDDVATGLSTLRLDIDGDGQADFTLEIVGTYSTTASFLL